MAKIGRGGAGGLGCGDKPFVMTLGRLGQLDDFPFKALCRLARVTVQRLFPLHVG